MKVSMDQDVAGIRREERPNCLLCGAPGALLYSDLEDLLFYCAPGKWAIKQCLNPACHLAWLDPMPLDQDLWKAYRNYYTHETAGAGNRVIRGFRQAFDYAREGYLARKFGYREAPSKPQKLAGLLLYLLPRYRLKAELSVMQLQARPGGRLLDIGCGHGWLTAFLGSLGWEAIGIDFDPEIVKVARSQGLKVRLGTLEAQHFPGDSFDAIIMSHVLEHIHDPLAHFRECHRLLKKGGVLALTTPNVDSWGHERFRQSWRGLEPPRHLYLFSSKSLKTMAEAAGFSVQTLTTIARMAPQFYQESKRLAAGGSKIAPEVSFGEKLAAKFFRWQEQFWLIFNADLGEEIFLKAIK